MISVILGSWGRLVSATSWHSFKIRLVLFINVPCGNGVVGQNHVGLISLKYKQPRNVCLYTKYGASDCKHFHVSTRNEGNYVISKDSYGLTCLPSGIS